ncbi:MAG: hypothetical protein KDC03_19455 [Flavobacteriales bacterium]|nr:hypothetical protein [Flavobacteriales bacterium]
MDALTSDELAFDMESIYRGKLNPLDRNSEFWLQAIDELEEMHIKLRERFGNRPEERDLGHYLNTSVLVRLASILEQSGKVVIVNRRLETRIGDVEAERRILLLHAMRNAYAHVNYFNAEDDKQADIRRSVLQEFGLIEQVEGYRENELPADKEKIIKPMFAAARKFLLQSSTREPT